jgi:hypothetical protein
MVKKKTDIFRTKRALNGRYNGIKTASMAKKS